jgi:MFS family permease
MTLGSQTRGHAYWLIGAVAFSKVGALSYTVVITWAVAEAAGNDGVGRVNAVAGLTTVLVGFFATFWLDKFDKRILLLLFDAAAAAVCLAAVAVLAFAPKSDVVLIAVGIAVATSAVASLYSPTSRALIPAVVPAEGLERFNSAYAGFGEVSRAAGPALGALLLAVGGPDAFALSLTVNGVSFVVSLLLTLPLPPAPPHHVGEGEQKKHALFLGFRFIAGHPVLRGEVLSALSINFFLTSTTFILLNRMAETSAEAYVFGLANLFEALGAVAAALTAAFVAGRLRRIRASQLMAPIAVALLVCLAAGIWATIISLTVLAVLVTIYNIVLFSRLQREIPMDKMGRVIAVVTTGSAALMPLGNLVFASLSTVMPTNTLIWITSAALIATGVVAGFLTKTK